MREGVPMEHIKCNSCDRLLLKIGHFDNLEIKCPRCKTLNYLSVKNALPDCQEQRMRQNDRTNQTKYESTR